MTLSPRVFRTREAKDSTIAAQLGSALCGSSCLIVIAALSGCTNHSHEEEPDSGANDFAMVSHVHPPWTTPTAPCDWLAARELPTQLDTIIAAGKDENGTIYVVDHNPIESGERMFVSRDSTLYRKRVLGGGAMGNSDSFWSFDDDGTEKRLVVHKAGDQVANIALAPPGERTFFDQLDDRAQELMLVDSASVATFSVRNLPGEVEVEFVADATDGSRIVVARPKDDWTYEDFRVYYGMNGRLFERVTSFSGPKSYRAFDFIVEGSSWHVMFASTLASVDSEIDTGNTILALTLVDPPTVSPTDSFECFVPTSD